MNKNILCYGWDSERRGEERRGGGSLNNYSLKCQLSKYVVLIRAGFISQSVWYLIVHLKDSVSQHSRRQVGGGLTETSVWADITTLTSAPRVWSIRLIPLIHPPPLASIPLDVVKGMVTVPPCF